MKTLDELREELPKLKAEATRLWNEYQAIQQPAKRAWLRADNMAREVEQEIVSRCVNGEVK